MAYSEEQKQEALALIDAGVPIIEVAEEKGIHRGTLRNWRKEREEKGKDVSESLANMKKQLATLSKRKPTNAVSHNIAMLSAAISKLEAVELKKSRAKKKGKPQIKRNQKAQKLKEQMLHPDYGLYGYQQRFAASEARFRLWLKARQIGATYSCAGEAMCEAAGGMDQLIISASENQALKWRQEIEVHAAKLGVNIGDNAKNFKVNDAGTVIILANNYRTNQSFSGSLWMDEFAWYPNPKKIWGAAVPMMGTKKVDDSFARLTILSTPFEEPSLFHQLCTDEEKYYMFDRFRTDIYQAMDDGLDFDLEIMRDLFDADTWASAYECQFIDDESALMSIKLIKSCVDPHFDYYTPSFEDVIYSGYDIGRTNHRSTLGGLVLEDNIYKTAMMDVLSKATFEDQRTHLKQFMNSYKLAQLRIDKTGIGMDLAEKMHELYRSRVNGVHFTNTSKEFMAKNIKKMFEDKRIVIPNDQLLIADIHAIKRIAGQKGFKYDAKANEHGHADRFWALALAAGHMEFLRGKPRGGGAWIM